MNTYQSYPICDWNLLELSYVCCVLFTVLATKASILRSQELRATSNGRRTWCALISLLAKLTMQTAGSGKAPFMFDCLRFQMVFSPTICIASSGWLCLVTYMMLQAMYEENALSSYTEEIKYRSGILPQRRYIFCGGESYNSVRIWIGQSFRRLCSVRSREKWWSAQFLDVQTPNGTLRQTFT